jgi:hypothetical protein
MTTGLPIHEPSLVEFRLYLTPDLLSCRRFGLPGGQNLVECFSLFISSESRATYELSRLGLAARLTLSTSSPGSLTVMRFRRSSFRLS